MRRPSSLKSFVSGCAVNFAVCTGRPRIVTWLPMPPSVDPMASISMRCSARSRSASFTSAVHMTPDEMIMRTLLRS